MRCYVILEWPHKGLYDPTSYYENISSRLAPIIVNQNKQLRCWNNISFFRNVCVPVNSFIWFVRILSSRYRFFWIMIAQNKLCPPIAWISISNLIIDKYSLSSWLRWCLISGVPNNLQGWKYRLKSPYFRLEKSTDMVNLAVNLMIFGRI